MMGESTEVEYTNAFSKKGHAASGILSGNAPQCRTKALKSYIPIDIQGKSVYSITISRCKKWKGA